MCDSAYQMHLTSDYIEATQGFTSELWGQCTMLFMEYITKDLTEKHWDGIFLEIAVAAGAPPVPQKHCRTCTQSGPNPSKTQKVQKQDKAHLRRRAKAIYGPEEQRQMVVADREAWESAQLGMGKGSCQIRK